MNHDEAVQLLEQELDKFRAESYRQLAARIPDRSVEYERIGASGAKYQVEIQCFWDGPPGGNIRVLGLVDDGGWRAFVPLSRDFIKSPNGSQT